MTPPLAATLPEAQAPSLTAAAEVMVRCAGMWEDFPRALPMNVYVALQDLRAALAAASSTTLPAPTGWRTIESAPKSHANGKQVHGVYLLGFCPDPDTCNLESAICVVWWEPLMKGGRGMWYGEGGYEVKPTHWMPLPAAPGAAPPPSAVPADKNTPGVEGPDHG